MTKKKNRGGGYTSPLDSLNKFGWQLLMFVMGDIPNPYASKRLLKESCKWAQLIKHPQDPDPEIPDSWYAVLNNLMHDRGIEPVDRVRVIKALQEAARDVKRGSLLEAFSAGETESLADNAMDVISNLFEGDIAGAISEGGDALNDLLSGGSWFW